MNYYDPHSGHQTRFLRADPTGRFYRIEEPYRKEAATVAFLGGAAAGALLALAMWLAI